jgi:hypothetical protein
VLMVLTQKSTWIFTKIIVSTLLLLPLSVNAQEWVTEEVLKQLSEIRQELVQVKEELRELKENSQAPVAARRAVAPVANKQLSIAGAPTLEKI